MHFLRPFDFATLDKISSIPLNLPHYSSFNFDNGPTYFLFISSLLIYSIIFCLIHQIELYKTTVYLCFKIKETEGVLNNLIPLTKKSSLESSRYISKPFPWMEGNQVSIYDTIIKCNDRYSFI